MNHQFVDDETRLKIFDFISKLTAEMRMEFFNIFFDLYQAYAEKPCYLFPKDVVESPAVPFNPSNLDNK